MDLGSHIGLGCSSHKLLTGTRIFRTCALGGPRRQIITSNLRNGDTLGRWCTQHLFQTFTDWLAQKKLGSAIAYTMPIWPETLHGHANGDNVRSQNYTQHTQPVHSRQDSKRLSYVLRPSVCPSVRPSVPCQLKTKHRTMFRLSEDKVTHVSSPTGRTTLGDKMSQTKLLGAEMWKVLTHVLLFSRKCIDSRKSKATMIDAHVTLHVSSNAFTPNTWKSWKQFAPQGAKIWAQLQILTVSWAVNCAIPHFCIDNVKLGTEADRALFRAKFHISPVQYVALRGVKPHFWTTKWTKYRHAIAGRAVRRCLSNDTIRCVALHCVFNVQWKTDGYTQSQLSLVRAIRARFVFTSSCTSYDVCLYH